MRKRPVGYRFSPTGEELIIYYLKNKIMGKTWLVDEAISEINICSYKPTSLPSLAKIKSDDLVWYFFCPREYISDKNKVTKRTTGSGFWKPTGKDRKIRDKRGKGVEIGLKKTLVYHQGKVPNEIRTPWIIHEYHITCLPQNQRTYVICQVMYKGEDGDILYGVNSSSEPRHSLVSVSNTFRDFNAVPELQVEQPGEENVFGMSMDDLVNPVNVQKDISLSDGFNPNTLFIDNINNTNVQPQTPCDEAYFKGLLSFNGGNFEDVLNTAADEFRVEQYPGEDNFNGLSVNDLLRPMNGPKNHVVSAVFDSNPNKLLFGDFFNSKEADIFFQQLYNDEMTFNGGIFEDQGLMMQENRNEHRPKKALSGIIVDSSSDSDSDSDAESISATSYQETSSPGSPNRHLPSCSSTDSCQDLQTSADPSISRKTRKSQLTRRIIPSKQEAKQGTPRAVDVSIDKESSLVKAEKKGMFMTEYAMERNHKNPWFIYFISMVIGFILLLALIGNIVSVLLPIKT